MAGKLRGAHVKGSPKMGGTVSPAVPLELANMQMWCEGAGFSSTCRGAGVL